MIAAEKTRNERSYASLKTVLWSRQSFASSRVAKQFAWVNVDDLDPFFIYLPQPPA
jgi:hypothetical protein